MEGKRQELFFDYFFPSNFTVVLSDHKQSHFQSFNLLYHTIKINREMILLIFTLIIQTPFEANVVQMQKTW